MSKYHFLYIPRIHIININSLINEMESNYLIKSYTNK